MIAENIGRVRLIVKTLANRKLDALDQLQMDHLKVRAIFLQIRATKNRKRQEQLYERARREIELHTQIEEKIFYPACEKREKLKSLVLEAREEHKQVKTLIREIADLAKDSDRWEPKVRLMMENVEHHAHEEESQLFPRVRRHFDYKELEEMGEELRAAKKEQKAAA